MRKSGKPLTPEYLRSLLHYEPSLGVFIWKVKKGKRTTGDVAGCLQSGHYVIIIDGVSHRAKELVHLYNEPPPEDHHVQRGIDMVRSYLGLPIEPHRARKNALSQD